MPMLDVSIALTSPYLVDHFSVVRRQEIVNSFGRSTTVTLQFNTVPGIVKPDGSNNLERERDQDRQCKQIMVVTRFSLRPASLDMNNWKPDYVLWNGDTFIVKDLRDNSNYGPGFVKAQCEAIELVPVPPTPQAALVLSAGTLLNLAPQVQLYSATVVSSTVVTFPAAAAKPGFQLFRNGQLITQQNNDYTETLVGNVFTITLAVALGPNDFLVAFA